MLCDPESLTAEIQNLTHTSVSRMDIARMVSSRPYIQNRGQNQRVKKAYWYRYATV
jgi:hypothetical protein